MIYREYQRLQYFNKFSTTCPIPFIPIDIGLINYYIH